MQVLNENDIITINFIKADNSYMVTVTPDCINLYQICESADDKLLKSINIE